MKISEIKDMLAETGLPVTYYQWPEQGVPELPYLVWLLPGSDNFGADDKVYARVETLQIELYANPRSFNTEAAVEAVLEDHDIFWDKESVWLNSEYMYETIYTAEVLIEAEETEATQEDNNNG